MAAKCVDRSGPSQNFPAMRYAARDEVFLPGIHWNALSVDDQGIATLHNDHVFFVIVSVCRGCRSFTAGPKRHLASACSIEYVTFDSWGRLNTTKASWPAVSACLCPDAFRTLQLFQA
jgi:hypothetical protein